VATRKINVTGRGEVVGTDIGFQIVEDGGVTIELDDGTRLRLKPIVISVLVSEASTGADREYFVQCINQALPAPTKKEAT
jgi:hypothetical protein